MEPLFAPDVFTPLAHGLQHPEGLCWDPLTSRIYCGGEGGQIYSVTLDGEVREVANTGGSVLGMAVDARGRVYACDYERQDVARVDPETGKVETYTAGAPGEPLEEPNWPVFDDVGVMYVTGSLNGAIFRVAPGGETEVWARGRGADGYPNGCMLSPDGRWLYVVQSHPEDDFEGGRVWRFPIGDDDSAGEPEIVVELPRTVPDGVTFDGDGNLYVAYYRPDQLDRVSADGTRRILVDNWEASHLNAPTNLAFVGANLDRAVAACVGEDYLAIADLGVTGSPLRYPDVG